MSTYDGESSSGLMELYRTASAGMGFLCSELKWAGCNPAAEGLLEQTERQLLGHGFAESLHPDSRELLDQLVQKIQDVQGPWAEAEVLLLVREQDAKPARVRLAADGTDGYIVHLTAAPETAVLSGPRRDSLRERAVALASLGSWEWSRASGEVSFSEEIYGFCGLRDEPDRRGVDALLELVYPEDREELYRRAVDALTSGEFVYELRLRRDDRVDRWVHLGGKVEYESDGRPSCMYGYALDITSRKQIELELQETVQRYNSLKRYNHDAVFSLDLEGKVINANDMATRLTGYTVEEIAGRSFEPIVGKANLRVLLDDVNNSEGEKERAVDKIRHKDGHDVEVLTTIAPIIINKRKVGFYILAKDITEQKRLLIEKEIAENTIKAKSEFLAMMSHELRTPMNGVIGMTDLLLDMTEPGSTEREYLEIIRKSGDTLLAIINDVLDYSKIEAGRAALHNQRFVLRDCIGSAMDVLQYKASSKGLSITVNIAPDVPETVVGDSDRLKQILLNLVGNSIKFTYTGGVMLNISVEEAQAGTCRLRFTVEDTGIGVPADQAHRLFEPFYQLDHFMSRRHEGTGLGLAITKQLVELMGGSIAYIPGADPGATFTFTVVFGQEDGSETVRDSDSEAGPGRHHSLRILVAEDNEINQLVLKKMLEKHGHAVKVVGDGTEVLEAVTNEPFDVVFMDVQMPRMNGFEATRAMKEALPPDKVPVIIAVTANALKGDRENCLAAGMDDYISKPVKVDALNQALGQFFQVK
ncbi:ATP-binding protein [Paenibacillus sp. CN-4]|uniref:ATP-binding protein n=1 Tax=Paenibacillus nanchangensis TaxID=3348343 RepID=UPI00397D3793